MSITLTRKNMVSILKDGDTIYIGDFTLEKIELPEKLKMIFIGDQEFIPIWDKKVFEHQAQGFSHTFPLTDNMDSIERACYNALKELINPKEVFKINPDPEIYNQSS